MTNSLAIGLGLVILVLIGLDLWFQTGGMVFLARRFADLVQLVAFWR